MKRNYLAFLKSHQSLSKEFVFVGLGQGAAVLAGLIGVRLMTGYLSPQSYGEISLVLTFTTLAQQLVVGPFSGAILRFFSVAKERNELNQFFEGVNVLINWTIVGIWIIGGVFSLIALVTGFQHRIVLLLVTVLYSVLFSLNVFFDNIQNADRQRLVVAWHQGVGQWLRYGLTICVFLLIGVSSTSALVGFTITSFLISISQIFFLRRKLNYTWMIPFLSGAQAKTNRWASQLLHYSSPFMIWGLFTWAQQVSDRWALEEFQSTQFVGYYTVLYQLGYFPITLLNSILVQFLTPIFFQKAGDGMDQSRVYYTTKLTQKLVLSGLCLTIIAALGTTFLSKLIFQVLVAPEYFSVHTYLPLMVLSGGIFATAQIFAMIPLNENKPHKLIAPKIITAVIAVILNFMGAWRYGFVGVMIGGLIFAVLYFLWVFWISRKAISAND